MKKLLIFCGFILSCGYVSAQNYGETYTPISRPTNSNYSQSTTNYYIENQESETEWEEHEITGIYTQAQSLEDIKRSDCIKINDDYYIPARVKNGTYDIEIGDKVDSKFYNIRNTQLYFMFRYTPYLYKFDEGYAEIYNNKGTFYKEK